MSVAKPFNIPKPLVMTAYKAVKSNAGSAGVDNESIDDFENNLQDNLYKIWNRMSSGTYFPPPVKAVVIPKKAGGERILGVPSVSDRVAQMIVKLTFEPIVEPFFHHDSYGYRPRKSALDAVGITRKRCWKYDWVLEFDIKGLFDNIDHKLMMRAVRHHTKCKWTIMYIERWLTAPIRMPDGSLIQRSKGTPQGGVISPVLSNLFLHYVFDMWMGRTFPSNPWCRYADDGLVHCTSEDEAKLVKARIIERFEECGLEIHPVKTRIVYCRKGNRKGSSLITKFDFLGFTFRSRRARNEKTGEFFTSFSPAASNSAKVHMRQTIRKLNIRQHTNLSLLDIAVKCEPILRGWHQYYGRYCGSEMTAVYKHFNATLAMWAMQKYRKLGGRKIAATIFIENLAKRESKKLFGHWQRGIYGFV